MGILNTLKFIWKHPINENNRVAALINFLKWQLNTRLNPYPVIYPFTAHSKFVAKKGLTGVTGNIYAGLNEFEDMSFLLHVLKADDLFVDVGANVGSYTILSSAEKGAYSITIEPIPDTYTILLQNIIINDMQTRVTPLNMGVGSSRQKLKFTRSLGTINHVARDNETDVIEVDVDTLDNIIQDKNPVLIKIDVEGFETEVIKGAMKTLANPGLKAIIIELNGLGKKYGYDESKVHLTLQEFKFRPCKYDPLKRSLAVDELGTNNALYVRDLEFIKNRIANAEPVRIKNKFI